MTRLPALPARRVVAALERAGFRVIRIKGSHCFLRHRSDSARQTIVPLHRRICRRARSVPFCAKHS
jgi:predicted RNA binding protein YcfA (HicA-like mRNA interferase family)